MSAHTFVPKQGLVFSKENEKSWQGELGKVEYKDHIVFTKESLINFLKTLDIHVDTNGTELKKLPKYAVAFGNLMPSERSAEASVLEETTNTQLPTPPPSNVKSGAAVYDPSGNLFVPTRKVRELPGGGSKGVTSIFAGEDEDDVPSPTANARISNNSAGKENRSPSEPQQHTAKAGRKVAAPVYDVDGQIFRPTRKVRELPGGGSAQIRSLFGYSDDES